MLIPYQKSTMAIAIAVSVSANTALAQEETQSDNLALEEVVVIAQKREQNMQDVPVAITAINAQTIKDKKIDDISDIGTTAPNVQIAPSPGGSTGATVAIRGAASINPAATWEPSVGIYMDGVFIAKNVGGIFDVAELSGIEILRGPQGTLYGKNTTGGAINLVSRKPAEEFGGKVKAGAGNYGYTEFGATIDTGRLGDVASFMFSYNKRNRDGFYDNIDPTNSGTYLIDEFKKLDSEAGLLKANFNVSDTVEIDYIYDFSKRDNTVAFGQPEKLQANGELSDPKRLDEGSISGAGHDKSESSGHSVHIGWDITEDLLLKSITAYREMAFDDYNDYDGNTVAGTAPKFEAARMVDQDQTSQEFQLIGNTDSWNYVAGLFYFADKVDVENPYYRNLAPGPITFPDEIVRHFYGSESTSYAAFGQADWMVTDLLTLTFGGRFTQEEKESYVRHLDDTTVFVPGPVVIPAYSSEGNTETWNNFSPMFVASYAFADDLTTYAKISQGWRSGGFNGESASIEEAETPYEEETTTAFELGMKAQWWDNRIQTNIAIFQNDTKDMQLSAYNADTGYSSIENAGEAQVRGFEFEGLFAISDGLTAFFNYGYLDSKYKDFKDPVTGEQQKDKALFAYAPENKYAIGLEYVTDLGFAQLRARADYSFTDDQVFYRQEGSAKVTASPSYSLLNARVAFAEIAVGGDQTLDFGLWGKNLTDEEYRVNGIPGFGGPTYPAAGDGINYYGDPRTYGADISYNF